ncbi:circularly permuted type 2 ATP-grasp protein [Geodermatophilus sp. YIM 151500]|uniref:circularly permuted type 2 ATP-grasp protein n=1 Tax=Geodermatophilus sp. YIM 151500 TaxID=2984531 RepID=UPI0021E4A419|nr:circularly permuted type 2 ATP-grasp protein [Geodermatophilus sp. YIM 151500]MCV2488741.1 circularly permuted type 2 ATP-grasp protein [Geodermatophilus sp. YIM 151500]
MTVGPGLDEALDPGGRDRPSAAAALAAVRAYGPAALAAAVQESVARRGVVHESGPSEHPFHIDPVPRVVPAAEWDGLAAGIAQRVRALEAFVADAHGPREAVRAGVVPAEVLDTNRYALGRYGVSLPPPRFWIGMAGPDVVRGADGRLVVLEDNVRTPTLLGYALAARELVAPLLGVEPGPRPLRPAAEEALRRMLRAAAGSADAGVAVLDDGGRDAVRWEVARLAELVGAPAVRPGELTRRGDALVRPDGRVVDLLWRRTSEERLHDDAGRLNQLGELLLAPLRAGRVTVVNAFGTGVADDKRTYPYVEDLVRFFCGEEPLLPSVPSYDLGDPRQRAEALPRLPELVLKPRSGSGGHGVLIGPRADDGQLARARAAVEAQPGEWIAQEPVALSTHPTAVEGELVPRHVDLRPFAVHDGRDVTVLPGGLTRVSLTEGDLVVNASQGGGGKDTWVL